MVKAPQGSLSLGDLNTVCQTGNIDVGSGTLGVTSTGQVFKTIQNAGTGASVFSLERTNHPTQNNVWNQAITGGGGVANGSYVIYPTTNADIAYQDSTRNNLLVIKADGKIGVGLASPACKLDVDGSIRCKSYTVATVPSAALGAGQIIYVSNDVGGAVLAFSDGTNWLRVTDRAIISVT